MQRTLVWCVFCCVSCRRQLWDASSVMTTAVCHAEDTCVICILLHSSLCQTDVGCVLNHDNSCVSCRMICVLSHDNSYVSCRRQLWDVTSHPLSQQWQLVLASTTVTTGTSAVQCQDLDWFQYFDQSQHTTNQCLTLDKLVFADLWSIQWSSRYTFYFSID